MTQPTEDTGVLYSFKALFNKNPIDLQTAFMLGVAVVVAAGWWHPSAKLLTALGAFVVHMLGLFLKAKTANKAVLNELSPPTES